MSNYYEGFEGLKLIANAMQRSNDIREKELNFAKEQWEFNKEMERQNNEANMTMAKGTKAMADYLQKMNVATDTVIANQNILYKEFQEIKRLLEDKKDV